MTTQNGFNKAAIQSLLAPTTKGGPERKAWSIGLEAVWVPFFTATNVMGETDIPSDVLGAPLRLNKTKDGEVKFSSNGRPMMKIAPELNSQINLVRENFAASLVNTAAMVAEERPDDYRKAVEDSHAAGVPILESDASELDSAMVALKAMAAAEAQAQAAVEAAAQAEGGEESSDANTPPASEDHESDGAPSSSRSRRTRTPALSPAA